MKYLILSILFASSSAFAPVSKFGEIVTTQVTSSALYAESAEEAIQAALHASKTYGATSKEARVAWDIVEEINASDNTAAFKKGSSSGKLNFGSTEEALEYEEKVQALSKLLDEQKTQIEAVKELASNIRGIKLVQPQHSPQPVSDVMVNALEAAKAASVKYGSDSTEAKLAWETVEDIAKDDFSEAVKKDLSEECLVETIEACEAIEELQKALHKNEHSGSGRYQG